MKPRILFYKANPTPAQAEAGNYKKRKIAWRGLTISVENEAGSVRRGVDPNGHEWSTKMRIPYGYINRTEGVDGDHVDVYLGPDMDAPRVYVVHQRKAGDWENYDEDKCMVGFATKQDAIRAYRGQYDDPRFLGPVTILPVEDFVTKVRATWDKPKMIKGDIRLRLPSGREYTLYHGDYSELFAKASAEGERWITVHPGGAKGAKGVPVLVRETSKGSGVYNVVGGAGGKLNYLKLRGIKPESSYKEQARERAKARRAEKKKKREKEKEMGVSESKKKARESVKKQRRESQEKFIQTVADAMGWSEDNLKPNIPEGTSDAARKKLEAKHHNTLMRKARDAVELQRQNLLENPQARHASGIEGTTESVADEPARNNDGTLSVSDLEDIRPTSASSLGFSAHYADRAAEHGASEDDIKREAARNKKARQDSLTDAQRDAIQKRGNTQKQIKAEIEAIRDPITADMQTDLLGAKKAIDLLKAEKALRATHKAANSAMKDIDESSGVKAYNLEVSAPDDDDVRADIENDLRTMQTRAFLSEVGKHAPEPEKQLRKHVAAGAFNSVNALAVTAGGSGLVDRSVVDVLGTAGAAQVLARRLHADLPKDEIEKLTGAMEDYHLHHYDETSREALKQAQSLFDEAKEIQLGEASHGDDFEAARELNHRRKEAVEQAHKILGTALGEMESNAALVTALKSGRSDKPLEVPLGGISDENAIRQARAIGLQRGDYSLDRVSGQQVLTVTPAGMDRLARPIDTEELQRRNDTLRLLRGDDDEDNWLPQGFARRPDLALDLKPGVTPDLAQPFTPQEGHLEQSLRDYIGGRAADGDAPADIVADIQSADFYRKAGDSDAYRKALDAVAPLRDDSGKMNRAEDLADSFRQYADEFVAKAYGGKIAPLHRQTFAADRVAQDALHRALSATPAGTSAYKPIGELTHQDQRALRDYFYKHVAKESPDAAKLRGKLEHLDANEPNKEAIDMFGDMSATPEWKDWKGERDELSEKLGASSLNWQKYADAMHGHVNAYASIQDLIRSQVSRTFHDTYNRLNPDAPLRIGRQVIRNNLHHLDAVDPEAREKRAAEQRALVDGLRERVQGKYASGAVSEKLSAAREQQDAFDQSQMGFFSTEEEPKSEASTPLKNDERFTLGQAADRKVAAMMGTVGTNFTPGQPVKLFEPTMSGKNGVMRQRAIKMIERNKRVALAAGTGAGKTGILLGAFSHLQSQGKAKRGLFLVPSIVVGQFGAEALRFLEPGKYKWHADPGANRAERIAAYKNPEDHFTVVTHQSFRDDMLHLGAQQAGVSPEQLSKRLGAMTDQGRSEWMKGVMSKAGIHYDFSGADEAHNTLNRAGKENSAMANVIDAATSNTEYFVHSTADPIKNDMSEAASLMQKLDPKRYGDTNAFMRRYGVDTQGAKESLKREMLTRVLPFKIEPTVHAEKTQVSVKPTDAQMKALAELDKNLASARTARLTGKVDIKAMKAISPKSFEGVPKAKEEETARELSKSLGILKDSGTRAILDNHPESGKMDAAAKIAGDRKGKPGVIFAHSLDAVNNLKRRLESEGHRVTTLTGADTSEDKAAKIRSFNPDQGERSTDIMIASDAGATGANLQSGQWLVQYDTPPTAMVHAQRNGRIFRIGQHNDVELTDLVGDHPSEKRARERLKTKYALRELMTSPVSGLDDTGLAAFLHERQVHQDADKAA